MPNDPAPDGLDDVPPRPARPAPSLPEMLRRQRRLLRRRVAMTSLALLAVAVIAALVPLAMALSPHRMAHTPTGPRPVQVQPARDGLHCAQDIAWDHTAQRIAVLGYAHSCPTAHFGLPDSGNTGEVLLYDASDGSPITQFDLGDQVAAALRRQHIGGSVTPLYQNAQFSPDGRFVAVSFVVEDTQSTTQPFVAEGMVYLDAQYSFSDVAILPTNAIVTTIWQEFSAQEIAHTGALPPSVAYQWNSDGALGPFTALRGGQSSSIEHDPVGNPASDAMFTIWQPGVATVIATTGQGAPSSVALWQTTFIATNPTGRQVSIAAPIQFFARVAPFGEATETPASGPPNAVGHLPLAPVRDAAMHAVYAEMRAGAGAPTVRTALAWRPDGHRLAAAPEPSASPSALTATVYDCASGRVLARLTPATSAPRSQQDEGPVFLRWSPDGTMLLAHDEMTGAITIWRGTMLPA